MKAKYRYLAIASPVLLVLALPVSSFVYESAGGKACARCHEIQASYDKWHSSTHRNVKCTACHGDALTFDVRFHLANVRRIVTHWGNDVPERVRLKHTELYPVAERCQNCHQQEFAQWRSGPHASTYQKLLTDPKHNRQRLLMDDCLRCHGMHYEGSIGDLVTPVDTKGPWKMRSPEMGQRAAIPCLACHQMHRTGEPLPKPALRVAQPAPGEELFRPSLALYDRRSEGSYSVKALALPAMLEGTRPVKISPDRRQALCYQCHAPLASMQVNSGDDRTPVGVHEGLSCLACHQKHSQGTRASCANCHPRLSNCGIDVEKMDTTFKDLKSAHNVHFVKCIDCHPKGVPRKPGVRRPGGVNVAAAGR
jgi:hypothetical protein